jgi:hypothetical protein
MNIVSKLCKDHPALHTAKILSRHAILLFLLWLAAAALPAQTNGEKAGTLSRKAKDQLTAAEDTLFVLAEAVVNDTIAERRFEACKKLTEGLTACLKTENSFHYPFSRMSSISILAPPDSSFRIFSWQMFVNDSLYEYYGLIQVNKKESTIFPLTDRSIDMDPPPTQEVLPPDQWYGVLYYKLYPFDTPKGRKYLLMGYDAYQFFDKRKIIDVLSFDQNGQPEFGAPVFVRQGIATREHRIVFDYSAEARVKVNWDDEYKMILFDHLIPMASPFGRGMTFVPDGSYDGFQLERGKWVFVDKVFNDVQEEAPRPMPILDARKGKDIMGREKKKKQ